MTLLGMSAAPSPRRASRRLSVATVLLMVATGCGERRWEGPGSGPNGDGGPSVEERGPQVPAPLSPLRINEACSSNDGNWVDEIGGTDDWIELVNVGSEPVELSAFALSDKPDEAHELPARSVQPGERVLLWADDSPDQGPLHLPFRLASAGESVWLWNAEGDAVDRFDLPAMRANDSLSRLPDGRGEPAICRYATPTRDNGSACKPPTPASRVESRDWAPYPWPEGWDDPAGPVVMSELALLPAGFVELHNVSDAPVDLTTMTLALSPHRPGNPWPNVAEGTPVDLPPTQLAPGAYLRVDVTEQHTALLAQDPVFEGTATLFDFADVVDRVDFMRWPTGATLARDPQRPGYLRYCQQSTPGAANDACEPVSSREVGLRLRHLRTPGDFAALAEGGAALQIESVKTLTERASPGLTHLLSARWELHYSFVREVIEGLPALDRCDPEEQLLYDLGWGAFSQREYFSVDARSYYLATLHRYAGSSVQTVEFTPGDVIPAAMIAEAFFETVAHTPDPTAWAVRPQDQNQVDRLLEVEGELPIVDTRAPFEGLTFQPLAHGVGFGTLTFIPGAELGEAALGPNVLVVTDDVPNDIPLVGGLVTEAFQTPLAHVNVLSLGRGTPNMALVDARNDERLAPYFDQLVRLEVTPGGFDVRPADPAEAEAFWERFGGTGEPLVPRLDRDRRELVELTSASLADLPAIGAKAAQMAELMDATARSSDCAASLDTPARPFAIPVVHSLEHYAQSGAAARLAELEGDAAFRADPQVRAEGLAEVRQLIEDAPVDSQLLTRIEQTVRERYGLGRTRFRSSSNTEDLSEFSGAGLYTSVSGVVDSDEDPIEDALRRVWASLYNLRAYDERRLAHVDESRVAMAVLVHPAFPEERANGVAVSRNVLAPNRSDQYYINAQIGEASVTNPAPGVGTDQLIYRFGEYGPRLSYESESTLTDSPVLSEAEVEAIACHLRAVHQHFQALLDPAGEDLTFAIEVEFKLLDDQRRLLFKQARPFRTGRADLPWLCL